ncbi:hypothetical protein [Sphingomonas sp. LaA6.9]|uniref:hypothetical protein n=1 Tax=Sphingomonas sp. LaA6.9 TaxID=2919914 RepID=UPI001F4F9E69|nr:hypothetical protein [Sphingomonas sp. LaA6.9]MCJ8158928.1 hypothetical protein [Sphingomonas sp. LaA6.9]
MTDVNWVFVLIVLAFGAGIIWWVWGRGAAPGDKPSIPAKPATPPGAAAEPAKIAEPIAKPSEPLAFAGEIPAQEHIDTPVPIAVTPAPKAPIAKKAAPKPVVAKAPAKTPAAKPKAEAKPAPAKAPAAKKAAAPAAKTAKAPVEKKPAAKPAAKTPAAKAPVAKPAAKPAAAKAAPKPKAAAKPAAPAKPDNLLQLKGVGPKLVTLLNGLGVNSFAQIAAWGPADIERVDGQLGTFKGRITRDLWIEQAGYLAKGDIKSFEAKFGKLDSEN